MRLITTLKKLNWFQAAAIGVITCNALVFLQFTLEYWGAPWPHKVLTVDGHIYLEGAKRLVGGEGIFSMADIYHSPAYQIYLAFWLMLVGSVPRLIEVNQALNALYFAGSLLLLFRLAVRHFSPAVAWLAVTIFSFSTAWKFYANMVQYEVALGFLHMVWLHLIDRNREKAAALVLATIIFVHSKALPLLGFPLWWCWKRRKGAWISLAIASAPLVLWSAVYSFTRGRFIFVMDSREWLFRLGNNPNAFGTGYPHHPIVEPSGWAFILERPASFWWLVRERFQFLWGIRADIWALPPETMGATGYEQDIQLWLCLIFFAGLAITVARDFYSRCSARLPIYAVLFATIVPPLFVYAHVRFLVAVTPLLALFQAVVAWELARLPVNRWPHGKRAKA